MPIHIATESDIEKLLPALKELRPHRDDEYLRKHLPIQFREGYSIAYIGDEKMAYAVAGFRILNHLFSGKTLYLDDLVTHSAHRKNGYGRQLLDWVLQYAKEHRCEHFDLDSGYLRNDAHRLYLNFGLYIRSLHFGRDIKDLKK